MIAEALHARVVQHDDSSEDSMYDLRIEFEDGTFHAVEVTMAYDEDSIELWRAFQKRDGRWVEKGLQGAWMVYVDPRARENVLRAELPALLAELQARGIRRLPRKHEHFSIEPDPLLLRVEALGVVRASQSSGTSFPGVIYPNIEQPVERVSGFVTNSGQALVEWIPEFLGEPRRADNLRKLSGSGAAGRHVFIVVPAWSEAPFGVTDILLRDPPEAVVPESPPQLPEPVTHVWLMSTFEAHSGLRWSPDEGWSRFRQMAPE